jgi:hypothetical protein
VLKDIIAADNNESFSMRLYHNLVSDTMRRGFHWTRLTKYRGNLLISNLRHAPNVKTQVVYQDVAERYERWYNWMLKQNGE